MELIPEDDRILRRKSKRISRIDDTIRNIAASMIEVMKSKNGIGIAAPQVGILKQIIVVLVNENPVVMINPEILETSEETCIINEGCLSFPGTYLDIERPTNVRIKYRELSGHPRIRAFDGIDARCVLHEIDHLQGIVFIEK